MVVFLSLDTSETGWKWACFSVKCYRPDLSLWTGSELFYASRDHLVLQLHHRCCPRCLQPKAQAAALSQHAALPAPCSIPVPTQCTQCSPVIPLHSESGHTCWEGSRTKEKTKLAIFKNFLRRRGGRRALALATSPGLPTLMPWSLDRAGGSPPSPIP